jgi:imidazolonepropionase-like amidohydrolase
MNTLKTLKLSSALVIASALALSVIVSAQTPTRKPSTSATATATHKPTPPPQPAATAPTAAPGPTIAITGGKVYPVSGPPIENATVVIANGLITAVGANVTPPAGAQVVDAKGKWITPGLINAGTQLGLVEVNGERSTSDTTATGDHAVAAAFRAWEGLNTASVLWAPARNEGVTTVVTLPSGGLVSGQGAVVRTAGASRAEMLRKVPAAMVVDLSQPSNAATKARGELYLKLRELLDDARDYEGRKAAYERAATRAYAVGRLELEALQPALAGTMLVLVGANRADDIDTAIDIAKEYKLRIAIVGGAEAWKVADHLAAAKIPVLTSALDNIPTSFNTLGSRQENAALLRKAGVQVMVIGGGGPGEGLEVFNVRDIRQQAGNAVAYGLPWDEALRAVTQTPAEVFGIDAAVGTIAVGKEADVVVWSGDPFEFSTRAEHVYIHGREVNEPSRQDLLTDRYKRFGKP